MHSQLHHQVNTFKKYRKIKRISEKLYIDY